MFVSISVNISLTLTGHPEVSAAFRKIWIWLFGPVASCPCAPVSPPVSRPHICLFCLHLCQVCKHKPHVKHV